MDVIEEWRPIPGSLIFEASNLGRIRLIQATAKKKQANWLNISFIPIVLSWSISIQVNE